MISKVDGMSCKDRLDKGQGKCVHCHPHLKKSSTFTKNKLKKTGCLFSNKNAEEGNEM